MGYKRQRKTLSLKFEDEPGLEILARSVSVRRFLRVLAQVDDMQSAPTQESIEEVFSVFAEHVISWTLVDDDDEPVPVGVDALLDDDFDWSVKLVMAWVGAITGAMKLPPLEMAKPEDDEADPVESSIPMSPATPG